MNLKEFCFKIYLFPWLAHVAEWKGLCVRKTTPFPWITLAPNTTFTSILPKTSELEKL